MNIERTELYPLEKEFHDAIRKTIMFYYYQILNNTQPTLEQLRLKFGSIFYKNMSAYDILAHSTLDSNMNALNLQGLSTLNMFYERESSKKFVTILVDADVRIPIGDDYLLLTIDLVREMNYSERQVIEVVKFTNMQKKVDTFFANHSIILTAHAYAFRKLFKATENRLILQQMKTGKEYVTARRDPEIRRLEAIVDGITDSIKKNKFYPVHNSRCNNCLYKDVCDKYKF